MELELLSFNSCAKIGSKPINGISRQGLQFGHVSASLNIAGLTPVCGGIYVDSRDSNTLIYPNFFAR